MKNLFILVIGLFCLTCNRQINQVTSDEKKWEYLFDKDHQDKWKIKISGVPYGEDYLNTVIFSKDMMEISYKNYKQWDNKFGHIFYPEKLSHYIVEMEYNIDGTKVHDAPVWAGLNSGIMLHSQPGESMTMNQWFPNSLEMQFLACKDSTFNPTGNLCTPGTMVSVNNVERVDHCMNSTSGKYPVGRWMKARAEVYGDSLVKHIIQDTVVFSYSKSKLRDEGTAFPAETDKITGSQLDAAYWKSMNGQALKEGYIALQAESQEIKFRNLKLLNLCGCMDKKAKNYKSYFIKSDNSKCDY